jgi:hypothetical protein
MSAQPPAGQPPDDLDFVIPTPRAIRGRSQTVSAAAGILAIAGLLSLVGAALISGVGGSGAQVGLAGAFGVVQLSVAVLVFRQVPVGRTAGLGIALVGLVFGFVRLLDGSVNAVLALASYGIVIWALASNGGAFRRE